MKIPLINTSLKFSSRNLFYFKLMGTLFLVHMMYFLFIIPFPLISWLKRGRAGKGCNVKKTPNNSLIVIQGKVEEFNLTAI